MNIKMSWRCYYDGLRKREFEAIFAGCPDKLFEAALELGAGRGVQARLLTKYAGTIISTDLNPAVIHNEPAPSVTYALCDAEDVGSHFAPEQFDLVFSSNLLEHLPSIGPALNGMCQVLRDDGIMIHVMPSPFWKVCHVCLHIPNQVISLLEKVTEPGGPTKLVRKVTGRKGSPPQEQRFGNNPKLQRKPRSAIYRLLIPKPHGVSAGNIEEWYAFSINQWKAEFTKAHLKVLKINKGPVFSGYGFGLDRVRRLLERLGLTSEYIYIVVKEGHESPYQRYF